MAGVTVVPAGTYWVRGSPSLFACSLQSTCTVISWMPVMERYLISSSLPLPFHFCVASSVPQNPSAPKRKDCQLALNALLEGSPSLGFLTEVQNLRKVQFFFWKSLPEAWKSSETPEKRSQSGFVTEKHEGGFQIQALHDDFS